MKKGIVLKLFTLTTALCMLILATIFIGQTIFFKQYYANRKVEDIKVNLNSFEKNYLNYAGNAEEIQKLEQDFLRENNTWITTLDKNGNLKHADDFYFEVTIDRRQQKSFGQQIFKIPLGNLVNIEEIDNKLSEQFLGQEIYFSGVRKEDSFIPFSFSLSKQNLSGSNKPLEKAFNEKMSKLNEEKKRAVEEQLVKEKKPAVQEQAAQELGVYIGGRVTKVQLPDVKGPVNPIYKNGIFLDSIKEFQTNLLLKESKPIQYTTQTMDYEKNDIKYKLLIKPIEKDGSVTYIYAMASLQPVDEAVQMVQDYYIYIIAFVVVLIFLASFYYSKQIAKPLLKINDTTKKIAQLDFTEKIPITSKDEIGDLSKNI
ncbi:HAMP domain-containing protein, partial [Bacillus cereus]